MFRLFFILFTGIALLEVMVFIKVGAWIGLGWTVAMVIITAAVGVSLLRIEGFDTFRRMQQSAAKGSLPGRELVEAVMLLISGALLLTPGFLTDIAGFVILSPLRKLIAAIVVSRMTQLGFVSTAYSQSSAFEQTGYSSTGGPQRSSNTNTGRVIEGEYEVKDDKSP